MTDTKNTVSDADWLEEAARYFENRDTGGEDMAFWANVSNAVKHTPGSWRVEEGTTLVWGNCNPDDHTTRGMGYPIAEARINPSGNWSSGPYADEGEANAHLIAAAPDMLEALELVAKHADQNLCSPYIAKVCAAISKAKGINPDD